MSWVRFLYNTRGDYVAFVFGRYVFSPRGEWLGYVPNGNLVYDREGRFLGVVTGDDRVFRIRNQVAPRIAAPPPPSSPITPARPLKRLRMPRPPPPYEDVFDVSPASNADTGAWVGATAVTQLEGAWVVAADGKTLGLVTKNVFEPSSLANRFGEFGSPFHPDSMLNPFGTYGGRFSQLSPFNEFSQSPPRVVRSGKYLGHLTVNKFVSHPINPHALLRWLGRDDVDPP